MLINHHFPLKLEASEKLNSTDTGFNGKQVISYHEMVTCYCSFSFSPPA